MKAWLEGRWYAGGPAPLLLRPLSALYGLVAALRRQGLRPQRLPVPVIVVGNLSVGGTGKTPFTLWLVEQLRAAGWRPGIVSRGYGGRAPAYPLRVTAQTDPRHCGDEPALMARRLACPLAVAPDRVAAARQLVESGEVDILVSDDGLQHYRLGRDLEVCVIDSARGLGNGALLPAGPLREPPERLREVDLIVMNGPVLTRRHEKPMLVMQLDLGAARSFISGLEKPLAFFIGGRVHAVAGIGNPERFFSALEAAGLRILRHPFPDHHAFAASDLDFGDGHAVLMTEKDAVKCQAFAKPHFWSVPVEAKFSETDTELVRESLRKLKRPTHG